MTVVVDSGVIIAMVLVDEEFHEQAYRLIQGFSRTGETVVAPMLLRYELTAVLRKAVYQGRITHRRGVSLLNNALKLNIELVDDDALLVEAFAIARQYGFARTYDPLYVALAQRVDSVLWSADQRLVRSVNRTFPAIRWLGDLS